jgi:hypothetical protein
VPSGVKRIKAAAARTFDPTNSKVELSTGDSVTYDYLVVCTGVKLDWGKVGGHSEAVSRGGVCSNYSPDHVNYTWECLKALFGLAGLRLLSFPKMGRLPKRQPEYREAYEDATAARKLEDRV